MPADQTRDESRANAKALCETYRNYLTVGSRVIEGPGCYAVRNDSATEVYDANFVYLGPKAEPRAAFEFAERELGDRPYLSVKTDTETPPHFEADFWLRDFEPDPTLQLLLEGALQGPAPREYEIRRAESDADWTRLAHLFRADHVETNEQRGKAIFSPSLTNQIVSIRRRAAREVPFFLAWVEGEAVAFFSSWPGTNGVGMVEDLFTQPSHRHRGIARALIHHCVADARERGAARVLIGAEPDDTPKNLYAALGFRPTCMTHGWVRRRDANGEI